MSRRMMVAHAAAMAVLGHTVFLMPGWDAAVWALIGLCTLGAIAVGVHLNGPIRRSPWWWLAGGVAAMTVGDTAYGAYVHGPDDPTPLLADVAYLTMFPLIVFGLFQLTRPSALVRDRSRLLDWLTFAAAGVLLGWVLVVGPALRTADADVSGRAAYALGCVLLLLATAGLALNARRSPAVLLLALGAVGVLLGDGSYLYLSLRDQGWTPGGAYEAGYLLFYVTWGQAALHPSMSRLTAPIEPNPGDVRLARKVLLALSLLVPPGALLVEALNRRVEDGVMIAAIATVIYGLVFARLFDAVEKHRRLLARERHLRQVCGALIAAADPDEVNRAVREALADLLKDEPNRVLFSMHRSDGVPTAASSVWGPAVPASFPLPTPAAARRTRLLRTRALHPALADQLGGLPATLVCPLVRDGSAAGPPRVGALFVAAETHALEALQDSIEVVAVQATLALERISLTDEVTRRESEQYVATVVQNTSDVVVIVDEADRIRYASPSLPAMLGVRPRAFGTLGDLVHPDDRAQVNRTLELARDSSADDEVREEWTLLRDDGSRIVLDVSCRDLRADKLVRGYVLTMSDAAGRHRREQDAIQRALLDSAPGKNRRSVTNRFK